jgi:hypothetical protein
MDDIAFDRLTRLFSASRSRREAARTVIGTLVASTLLGQNGDASAESGKGSGRAHGDNQPHRRSRSDDNSAGTEARRGRGSKKGKGKRKGHGKGKRNDACTKADNTPKRGKPCCEGLVRDDTGKCAAEPSEGCRPRTCADLGTACGPVRDGCGGMLNCGCGSGEVCCDGSCHTGVCCADSDCGLSAHICTNNECFCGAGPRCTDDKPTCCPSGVCMNTVIDSTNCGTCGHSCDSSQKCCDSTCTDTDIDEQHCGKCGVQCVIGEQCIGGQCTCGTLLQPCNADQSCVGGVCGECKPEDLCGGACKTCPNPPGFVTPEPDESDGSGQCCATLNGESFCSCNGACCKDACFYQGSSSAPTGEFCCIPPNGYICPDPEAKDDPSKDRCCPTADCNCFGQTGRFGSNRRPGR